MPKHYEKIYGYFDFQPIYEEAVRRFPNGKYIEIGAFLGKSTCYMAELIKEKGVKPEFYTIDTFLGEPTAKDQKDMVNVDGTFLEKFKQNLRDGDVLDYVNVIVGDSIENSKRFENNSFDFIFIDANHQYEFVKKDLETWYPKLKLGGIIAGHDYWMPPVKQAVNEFFSGPQQQIISSWIHLNQ